MTSRLSEMFINIKKDSSQYPISGYAGSGQMIDYTHSSLKWGEGNLSIRLHSQ